MTDRTFDAKPATRERVPLLVGLMGPSGCGKTMSALRLATGMQRVTDGEIYVIDTESRRALHYADDFEFQHVQFDAPFSPLDYLAAIEFCVSKGAKIIVVDSLSHEHEGPGGVLEWHDKEMGGDFKKSMIAWQKPKAARRRLINNVLQLGVNAICCFRAKEKMKIIPKKEPVPLGWMPIAGEEFLYEQTVNCLLYPASGGVPTWKSDEIGERAMMKCPRQFNHIFADSQPLSEDIGQQLAEWAEGSSDAPSEAEFEALKAALDHAESIAALDCLLAENRSLPWTPSQRELIREAYTNRKAELAEEPADA